MGDDRTRDQDASNQDASNHDEHHHDDNMQGAGRGAGHVLDALGDTARAVLATTAPAVVSVGRPGRGSGIVVDAGVVLTNAHNLKGDEVTITFGDGEQHVGTVAGVDADGDLATVRVPTGDRPPARWADAGPDAGDVVFALSGGRGRPAAVSFGIVAATQRSFRGPRRRRISGSIEHTAVLPRGASGGPVVDRAGRVLGINTHRLEGTYLAQPIDADLRARLDGLVAGRAPARRTLGVGLVPAGAARRLRRSVGLPDRDGVLVRVVVADGPADRAGVREGDLLVRAGGRSLTDADDLMAALDAVGDDDTLVVEIVRGAEELSVTVSFTAGGDGVADEDEDDPGATPEA
ncbi:MAG: trypsin-like peptidase domain-containing protein [Actinomycetota bacterium]|nr:trypsin-like peptidase domain-containing protein [Actinomycetota bacterium]